MRVAALDLGSNTFLLLVVDLNAKGELVAKVADETETVRLGQGVHQNRVFHPEALARSERCFARYEQVIKATGAEKVVAVATSAARDVKNRDDFFALGKKYGLPIQVITGELEARLTYTGATSDFSDTKGLVVLDVGGGSTEIFGRGEDGRVHGASVDLGSVRMTEAFIHQQPVVESEYQEMMEFIRRRFLEAKPNLPRPEKVVAVAGTPCALACLEKGIDFDEDEVHKTQLNLRQIEKWIEKFKMSSVTEKKRWKGMPAGREDVIVGGASILVEALKFLAQDRLTVSVRGVRYGAALLWRELGAH